MAVTLLLAGCFSSTPGLILSQDVNKTVNNEAFTDLNDTPPNYTGQTKLCAKVNSDENGLEFGDCGTGGRSIDANGSFLQSFINRDLTTGVIRISHDLNDSYPSVTVFNSNELIILPDNVLFVDVNSVDINLLNFVPLIGTWNTKIITSAGTGVTADSNNGFTADFNNFNLTNGILIVSHDLARPFPLAIIYNDLNKNVLPDDFENITVNRIDVNLLNFVPISGLWRVRITANN